MYFVYELVDPRNNVTGYIGITNNPNQRYLDHVEEQEGKGKKGEWIKRLQEEQVQPKMNILEVVDDLEQARKREQYWIQYYLNKKVPLVNIQLTGGSAATTEGFYSATEARKKLGGIAGESLKRLVNDGKIRRVLPPDNKKRGLYVKEDVDKLAMDIEQFWKTYIITEDN